MRSILGRRDRDQLIGRTSLAAVSLLYGTLAACLKWLYGLDRPPTPEALVYVRSWMSVVCFWIPGALIRIRGHDVGGGIGGVNLVESGSRGSDEGSEEGAAADATAKTLWADAIEIAFWGCGSFALINLGVRGGGSDGGCSSTRASFLTQTSVVLTPLISLAACQRVGYSVWAGCLTALVGLMIISSSSGESGTASASTFDGGAPPPLF